MSRLSFATDDNPVSVSSGRGGLKFVRVRNRAASGEVCLNGAHVTDFRPRGCDPVLWLSPIAEYQVGRAIRGGIPVMWPWFGKPDDNGPQHGLVRTALWQLLDVRQINPHKTEILLGLTDSAMTRAVWPHSFELQLRITVGHELELSLRAENTGHKAIQCGGGFHPYFNVGDISAVSVRGLAATEYFDKVKDFRRYRQDGDLRFVKEIDRVYLDHVADTQIIDRSLKRRIRVSKSGSHTTVVWNPWQEGARRMLDFPDDAFKSMVCVEAVNAFDDLVAIAPGHTHTISQTIRSESLNA